MENYVFAVNFGNLLFFIFGLSIFVKIVKTSKIFKINNLGNLGTFVA